MSALVKNRSAQEWDVFLDDYLDKLTEDELKALRAKYPRDLSVTGKPKESVGDRMIRDHRNRTKGF